MKHKSQKHHAHGPKHHSHAMNDRSMHAKSGKPQSSAFFPEEAHSKVYGESRPVFQGNYPDTPELVLKGQKETSTDIDRGKIKEGHRH